MTQLETRLELDDDARRALAQVYGLLIRLAENGTADGGDPCQDTPPAAQRGAEAAPTTIEDTLR
jgi:hypothetical protein